MSSSVFAYTRNTHCPWVMINVSPSKAHKNELCLKISFIHHDVFYAFRITIILLSNWKLVWRYYWSHGTCKCVFLCWERKAHSKQSTLIILNLQPLFYQPTIVVWNVQDREHVLWQIQFFHQKSISISIYTVIKSAFSPPPIFQTSIYNSAKIKARKFNKTILRCYMMYAFKGLNLTPERHQIETPNTLTATIKKNQPHRHCKGKKSKRLPFSIELFQEMTCKLFFSSLTLYPTNVFHVLCCTLLSTKRERTIQQGWSRMRYCGNV